MAWWKRKKRASQTASVMGTQRTAQGVKVGDKLPKVARLKAPELQADWSHYQQRSLLRNLTPQRIASIFDAADTYIDEQITLGALMEESDDHLNGTLDLRRQTVLRLDAMLETGDPDNDLSVAAAEAAQEIVGAPWFYAAREWLLRAVLHQWTAVELLYELQGSLWMPRGFRAVEPERWHFEAVEEGGDPVPLLKRQIYTHGDYLSPDAGKFIVHSYSAVHGQPGRYARVRAVAKLWYLGRLALTEWGGLIDSWFQPFTHLTYQSGLSETEIQTAVNSFLELASRKIAATPEGTTVTLHDVPDQTPHKDFQDFIRRAQSKLLLGQDTSQNALAGQETGATVQGEVRDDIRDADARLLDASLNETLFGPWCAWNFGANVAPPLIKHVIHESVDPQQRSQTFEAAQRLGLHLMRDQVYGELNLEVPPDTPEVLAPPPAPAAGSSPMLSFRRSEPSIVASRSVVTADTVVTDAAQEWASSMEQFQAEIRSLAEEIDAGDGSEAEKYATLLSRLGDLMEDRDPKQQEQIAELLMKGQLAALGRGALDTQGRINQRGTK